MGPAQIAFYAAVVVVGGALAGFSGALFGIGGATVLIPVFLYLFKSLGASHTTVMHLAAGTALSLAIPNAIAATRKQLQLGNLDTQYYRSWAIAILIGAILGVVILRYLTTEILQAIFVFFVVAVAIYMGLAPPSLVIARQLPAGFAKGAIGFGVGVFSVLTGVGGGIFVTPILALCSYPIRRAMALATATTFIIGLVGAVGAIIIGWGTPGRPEFALGYVDLIAFLVMSPIVWVFSPLGARVASHINPRLLRKLYALFLLLLAGYVAYELWLSWSKG
jgi:uncharacterized protein